MAFSALHKLLLEESLPLGFTIANEELVGPFGSDYIELRRGTETIMLIWDGRDSSFRFEHCDDAAVSPYPVWKSIAEIKFDYFVDTAERLDEISASLNASIIALAEHLARD